MAYHGAVFKETKDEFSNTMFFKSLKTIINMITTFF